MPFETDTATRKRRLRNGPGLLALAACCALMAACQHTPQPESMPTPMPPVVEAPMPAQAAGTAPAPAVAAAPGAAPGAAQAMAPVEAVEDATAGLLRYATRLRAMGASELKQELNTLVGQGTRGGTGPATGTGTTPKTQMQLALVLLQIREPVETARALGLLQRVATSAESGASGYKALAYLLIDNLITTRRLEDNLERTSQQLRESQRRIDVLNERLDAMRAIERSMNAPPPNAPRPVRQ